MELVYSVEDPIVVHIARSVNIRPVLYAPDWIYDYIKTLARRKQRPTLTAPFPGKV